MRTLYHFPLSPFCRKVRIVLDEKQLDYERREENMWAPSEGFTQLNPLRSVPVFVDGSDPNDRAPTVLHSGTIAAYLDEVYPETPLIFGTPIERAEIRRLSAWFDERYDQEVGRNVFYEKIEKRYAGLGSPDMDLVRLGLRNIEYHLEYISILIEERNWLAGEVFSLADITAAAHISVCDYLGDVPWVHFPMAKDWYVRIKSRKSFRPLLKDRLPGMAPSRHYPNLDF